MIRSLVNRIHSDYFLRDRIGKYDEFIKKSLDNGYEFVSHSAFADLVARNEIEGRKLIMIRHDIDSDPKYCNRWLEIERKYGIRTSYFFRLCTLDTEVMKELQHYGCDCGYHYEELATFAKQKGINSAEEIKKCIPEIRTMFLQHLSMIEQKVGFPIKYIASHGDFANRKLGVPNHFFVDPQFLREHGIEFETYDPVFLENYSINIMDAGLPTFYVGSVSPEEAIESYPIIHLLVHPKNWRSSFYWNSYENLKRLVEGIKFRVGL